MSRIYKAGTMPAKSSELIVYQIPVFSHEVNEEVHGESTLVEHQQLEQAKSQAQTIISDAEEIARDLIERAKKDLMQQRALAEDEIRQWWSQKEQEWQETWEQAKSSGYQAGWEEGKKEGWIAAEQEYQDHLIKAREVLHQSFEQKEQIIAEAEPFLVTLSVEIAKKVIGQELKTHPEVTLDLVKQMLQRAKERETLSVQVHPDEYAFIQNQRTQLLALVDGQVEIKVYPDPSVQMGGCIVRTSQGSLDARIDTQLQEIREVLIRMAREVKE